MKRLFDIVVSFILLLIFIIPMFITAILVYISMGPPVIFTQMRPGLHERPFFIYKFRTMTDERDSEGKLLPNKYRITRVGKFLRKTSLDELPQLLNVLKGELSLVGPRPLLMEYLPLYTEEQARRHDVRPGMTGWAQVNGRNSITWEERFEYDLWYVDNQSFLLDVKILFMTAIKVFKSENITPKDKKFVEKFKGEKRHDNSR